MTYFFKKTFELLCNINSFVTKHNNNFSAWASIITIISLPIILLQLASIVISPDVDFEFVHPSFIGYKIVNNSSIIAEDTLVTFAIFDIDSETPSPLPIPIAQIDYINPKSVKGPWKILEKYAVHGHRYFGIAYVGCRGSKNLKRYWIYTKYGYSEETFYAKCNNKDTYNIQPLKLKMDNNYLEQLVPHKRRNYIK